MPRKKVTTTPVSRTRKSAKAQTSTSSQSGFPNSYMSLLYGVITVFVLFLIVIFGIRVLSNQQKGEITQESTSTTAKEILDQQKQAKNNQYTVVEGDTLWSIAESQMNDGFKWSEIAKANNVTSPDQIEKGMKLTIPKGSGTTAQANEEKELAQATTPTVSPSNAPTPTQPVEATMTMVTQPINGGRYTIQQGDNLWDIAVRAYGDGFKWSEIATANSLENPRVIHANNELVIPKLNG